METDPKRKTICLVMIVKNESHIIVDTLKHLAKYIKFDYWVISDTGSTDTTKEDIIGYFKEVGIPGELDETPWQDFAFNRTRAFNVAYKKADYGFVWDADDEIYGDFALPENPTADAYRFVFGNEGGLRYERAQLFNMHKKWHYVGVLHEYPACLEDSGPSPAVTGNYYFISGRRGARNKDPDKYLKDALILEKAFNECYEKKDAIYNRYCFYTAQSYNSCNMHDKSIEYYKKVLKLDNWLEEKYVSCIEIYDQYDKLERHDEGLFYLVEAYRYNPIRIEGVYRLVKYYCIKDLPQVAYAYYTVIKDYYETKYVTDDLSRHLFAKGEEYEFYLPYYMLIVGQRIGRFDTCAKVCEILFQKKYLYSGEWWIHNLFHNIQFTIHTLPEDLSFLESMLSYISKLRERGISLTSDNYKVVDKVIAKYRPLLAAPCKPIHELKTKEDIKIMLTITTCKRFDLFEQTVYSMMKMWGDIDKVDYFFCVDDNSSLEDRMKMQTKFPFINYYMKSPSEKGHRESMNIIWNKLKEIQPTYWIHMEDDWLYFKNENYITKCQTLLEKYESQNVHQIVFNRVYGLMMEDMDRVGGPALEPGVILHEKKENVIGKNCAYWPHYSIQPSMIRTKVILELGNYDSENTFFERDYAEKYYAAGYKTAFFDFIFSLHIGKQHWEKDGKNAYALNEVGQFKKPSSEETTIEITLKDTNSPLKGGMKEHLDAILYKIKSGTYFGLIRPSDGEYTILKNSTLTNLDSWTFKEGGKLREDLLIALQTIDPNLYIGIPCNTCNKPWNCTDVIYNDFIEKFQVPIKQRTYANIVGNSNWPVFSEFMKSYTKGFFLITSGTMPSTLPIKERFIIDPYLVNNWDTEGSKQTERLLRFISDKKDELICFSAGPLSKVWIPKCMKINPNNMYIDIGASLDIYTKGQTNRMYTNPGHPYSKEACIFKDSINASLIPMPIVSEPIPLLPMSPYPMPISTTTNTNTNLIYFCVFHNKDYAELLKILLITIKFYSKTDTFDLLVFTSQDFGPIISELSNTLKIPIQVKFFDFTTMQQAACARLSIFEYENIDQYKKILYLDTDIIIQNDLSPLFNVEIEDRIYAMREGTIEHEYHGGWFFDFSTINKDIIGMNSGILLFQNTESIRGIFKDIREHIASRLEANKDMPCTQDQPFINYHFVKNGKQDTDLLEKYGLIYCIDPPPPPSAPTNIILCHFVWPIGNAQHKKNRMLQHVTHILKNYSNISNNIEPFSVGAHIHSQYSWGSTGKITLLEHGILNTTWANGTYRWLDKFTLEASWSGFTHLLRMNTTYTEYNSIRIGDVDYVSGIKV